MPNLIKKLIFPLFILIFLLFPTNALVIKIGSIAPESSPWGIALNKMASEWKQISGGTIDVKIYHNGIAGDEPDALRKMKIGQLQGAVLTNAGLNFATPEFMTFSAPFLIRTDAELDYILDKTRPFLEQRLASAGFYTLSITKAGWLRFFSKKPIFVPNDLKSTKLCVTTTDTQLAQAFKTQGYHVVPMPIPEVMTGLNSGMVDSLYGSPLAVGGFQWFGIANNMASVKFCPILGGIIISDSTWRKIPENIKPQLLASVRKMEDDLNSTIVVMEKDTIQTMVEYGLTINNVSKAQEAIWQREFEESTKMLLGNTFDTATYNLISSQLKVYRSK